ncbi:MAG: acyl--CoA ligase [Actinomycetota bacterium]|nr:acyl--CoA ligase [Actinomycetota bacterium]
MNTALLLEMAADGAPDRVAVGSLTGGITYSQLLERSRRAATWVHETGCDQVGLVDLNSPAVPVLLFGSALAGRPFVPVSYRLAEEQLQALVGSLAPAAFVVGEDVPSDLGSVAGITSTTRGRLLEHSLSAAPYEGPGAAGEDVAVLLPTSGTTGTPKVAVLRHDHLTSYVLGTVDFLGADEDEAALVSVPPYHVAGLSAVLSSVYGGRRLVQLASFTAEAWVEAALEESITHAMVVPTMLGRILDVLTERGQGLPCLRHLSYGGGRMPLSVVERALEVLPDVDFVNAYGLTETSSTVSVLGPRDHRDAAASSDPATRRRLASVGRPIETLELEIRDSAGGLVPLGTRGEIWVRGPQVAGEYLTHSVLGEGGWFPTKDAGWRDEAGFLYLDGRMDDVIVRGAENLSPGEIEDVLLEHPAVAEAAVVGVPDETWGEQVVAAVVLAPECTAGEQELQAWVRDRLRSTRTPARVEFREALPYNETGKLLRRILREEVGAP